MGNLLGTGTNNPTSFSNNVSTVYEVCPLGLCNGDGKIHTYSKGFDSIKGKGLVEVERHSAYDCKCSILKFVHSECPLTSTIENVSADDIRSYSKDLSNKYLLLTGDINEAIRASVAYYIASKRKLLDEHHRESFFIDQTRGYLDRHIFNDEGPKGESSTMKYAHMTILLGMRGGPQSTPEMVERLITYRKERLERIWVYVPSLEAIGSISEYSPDLTKVLGSFKHIHLWSSSSTTGGHETRRKVNSSFANF